MKGLEDFLNDLKNDENLQKKFSETKDPSAAQDLLKKEGYHVSEDELMEFYLENVSGGFLDSNETNVDQGIGDSAIVGNSNIVWINQNNGNVTTVDPMEVLKLLLGK